MGRGRPKAVTDKELFDAAKSVEEGYFGATEIASKFDEFHRETARKRLNELVEAGLLVKKKIGGQNVYALPDSRREIQS